MMKQLISVLICFLCTNICFAQDLDLIISNKDSIRCKIVDLKNNDYILYTKSLKPADTIKFPKDSLWVALSGFYSSEELEKSDAMNWRFGINTGYAYRIAPTPYDLPDELIGYKRKLRSGISFGTDVTYFDNPNIGFGLKYNLFHTNNSSGEQSYEKDGIEHKYNSRSDKIYVHYIGPFFCLRSVAKKDKIYANFEFSIGYNKYYNKHYLDEKKYKVKGNNFGFVSSLGADFMISKVVSLGVNINISAASIGKIKVNGESIKLKDDDAENLSRIGIGFVFRYYK